MVEKTKIPKAGLVWLLKMAWRDGKASWKKLTLFMASIVLGIAALVSIQSFSDNFYPYLIRLGVEVTIEFFYGD